MASSEEEKQKVRGMSVKELKQYLEKHGVDYSTCVEKSDLLNLALEAAETPLESEPLAGNNSTGKANAKRPQSRSGKNEFCCCWQFLLPENAPAWYVAKIGGGGSGDCHSKPAPEGSLFLLGHVSLAMPDAELARTFFETGLGCKLSSRGSATDLRFNAGPSQIWIPIVPGKEAERWPGDIRMWVDNVQTTYDFMASVDGGLKTKLVSEYGEGINGGEFSMKIVDPYEKSFFVMTDAPKRRAAKIRQIGCESSAMKSNVLAISDISVKTSSRADTQLMAQFYKHFFQAAITVEQYSSMVHFSPGRELHQTITFREDSSAPPMSNLGSLCIYVKTKPKFHLTYAKCAKAGIVESPATWEEAQEKGEFVLKGIVDPDSGRMLIALRNIVRSPDHLDCLVTG